MTRTQEMKKNLNHAVKKKLKDNKKMHEYFVDKKKDILNANLGSLF